MRGLLARRRWQRQRSPVVMSPSSLLLLFLSTVWADPCPTNLYLPFSIYSDSMGCVFADIYHIYDRYDEALGKCKEVFGEKARLVEILSEEDQEFILPLMKAAEEYFYPNLDTECLTWWWSGLTDMDDDGIWEWPESGVANYTNWHMAAVPNLDNFNCMQLLSATCGDGKWMTYQCSDAYINTHPICQLPN